MQDAELRIALVCYGGLSLAVYMHGITKEIHKLTRASKIYHSPAAPVVKAGADYAERNDDPDRESDTEAIYYELLQALGADVDLRIIVDVIAGTSAGGINGIMLARALAHDLPLDAHRQMWLEFADVSMLMEPDALARRWSKPFVRPVLWGLTRAPEPLDAEASAKLSRFVRSAWFRPPFSGSRFSSKLIDAMRAMDPRFDSDGKLKTGAAHTQDATHRSLLPRGHGLSLFVTLTNLHGYGVDVTLHDPPSVRELEFRHLLTFRYRERRSGAVSSHFTTSHVPGLAFAARGTSSYGGLFPPATLGEIERVMEGKDERWDRLPNFEGLHFDQLRQLGEAPGDGVFIDGGVLNNKPFDAAIAAIRGRPAQRQVHRRLLYIEPNPQPQTAAPRDKAPGFFGVIRRAFAELPRAEPIRDALASLEARNEHTRQLRRVFSTAIPRIRREVTKLIDETKADTPRSEFANLRTHAEQRSAQDAGYAFDGYIEVRLQDLATRLSGPLKNCDTGDAPGHGMIIRALRSWTSNRTREAARVPDALTHLDVDFRIRRLRFVISKVNELYAAVRMTSRTRALDSLKQALYAQVENLQDHLELVKQWPSASCVQGKPDAIDGVASVLEQMADAFELQAADRAADRLLTWPEDHALPELMRDELVIAYLGFPYFDVLSYPVARWRDLEELDEVKVMRLSAEDSGAIRSGGAQGVLKGIKLFNFGAFFSRAYRENDYLWGRLHGAERMVDLILSAAEGYPGTAHIDAARYKRKLFNAILEAEAPHLPNIPDEIARIREEIDALA